MIHSNVPSLADKIRPEKNSKLCYIKNFLNDCYNKMLNYNKFYIKKKQMSLQ